MRAKVWIEKKRSVRVRPAGRLRLAFGLATVLGYALFPLGSALAQGDDGLTDQQKEAPVCENLLVLDFITDAEGKTLPLGDTVGAQYWLWGVGISATTGDGHPSLAKVSALPTDLGPVNVLEVGEGDGAGKISFTFRNLLSVEAVTVLGAAHDSVQFSVYDQNSTEPAVVPVTPGHPQKAQVINLSRLGAATGLDVKLVAGSGIAQVVLCPQSIPKLVNRYQSPDLELTANVGRPELLLGETTEVTVTVRNVGGAVGFDLIVLQDLPAGLVFADDNQQHREWELEAIAAGGSFTFGYPVRAVEAAAKSGPGLSYLVALISNGKGSDGASSQALSFTLPMGSVLGTETEEPPPSAAPAVPPVSVPAADVTVRPPPPVPEAEIPAPTPPTTKPVEPRVSPRPSLSPTDAPTSPPALPPIGGPLDAVPLPLSLEEPEVIGTSTLPEMVATTVATTTGATADCVSWLWILTLLNAALIIKVARQERLGRERKTRSRSVVAMLVVAVPLILWYPACALTWWLVVTAAGIGLLVYAMGRPGRSGGGSPPPVPPASGGPTDPWGGQSPPSQVNGQGVPPMP